MKIFFESHKLKSIAWKIIAIVALGYLSLMDILVINMFQLHITDEMRILTGFVWLFFISGIVLRLLKSKQVILPFIVIVDLTLVFIMFYFGGFTTNSFWELFLEPAYILIILSMLTLILDWRIRYKRLNHSFKWSKWG